jgi:hypothetical protein
MLDRGVAPEIVHARLEHRRAMDREWALKNKEKKAANKKAYIQRKKQGLTKPFKLVSNENAIKCTYRPNWKEAPVYDCPELTYRGKV